MIYLGSRYQNEPIFYTLDGRNKRTRSTVMRSNDAVGVTSTTVAVWTDGARLDNAAFNLYGNPQAWWRIMDENIEILDPMSIKPGMELRIP